MSIQSSDTTSTNTLHFLDNLLSWSLKRSLPVPLRYAAATGLIVLVGLFRALVVSSIVPWLLFIPVVLAIALLFGRNPGVYASVLAAIVAGISLGNAGQPYWLTAQQWTGSILFVVVISGIAVIAAELRAAFARAQQLTEEKDVANVQLAEREAFLSSVLASSTDCIKILDLEGRLTFMSEGGKKIMEVNDFNTIAGCPWPDFWQDRGNVEARAALAAAREGNSRNFIGIAPTMTGISKWWHVAVSPVIGADGKPESILSVSRDITATRENEEERNQLARIVENSADFVALSRLDGSVFFLNDAALNLVGLDRSAIGQLEIADFFAPEEMDAVRAEVLPAVERDGFWSGERLFRHFETSELIPILYTVFHVLDADGAVVGHGTVTRDLRERKRAEEQQQLLNNELSHRLKNVLAVVQSVASQTLRQASDLVAADEALNARLSALAQATDVLTARSWTAADLLHVVERTLSPHGDLGKRIHVSGPRITLLPEVTMAFALALHELATNACKYGALSNEDGHVDLSWNVTDGSTDDEPRFHLSWREVGGPPISIPAHQGFGTKMIERSLRSYFRGPARLEYRPDGLVFQLESPLAEAGKVVK